MLAGVPSGIATNLAAAGVFFVLAVVWTFPLVGRLTTDIPGSGAGDNVAALWNLWWGRFAWTHQLPVFQSDYLFAPSGTSLALHTHLALPALAGATILGDMPLVLTHNLLLLATLFLNASCTYWLIRRLTTDWQAALVGAVVFAGSPFISGHLHGHFNVLSAWTLPLVAIAATETARGSRRWAVAMGVAIGLTMYLDYYYAVYAVVLGVGLVALESRSVAVACRPRLSNRSSADTCLAALIALDAAAIGMIVLTGGFRLALGPVEIRADDPFNALQAFWALGGLWIWRRWRPRLTFTRTGRLIRPWHAVTVSMATAALVSSPLWIRIVALAVEGEYVAQAHYWRSGAQGIDLVTLVAGNPFSHWSGGGARWLNGRLAIDPIERSGWLGVVPMILAAIALRQPAIPHVGRWALVGGLALVWALGPHLTVLGQNTGMVLPNALLRYVPIVSNARIPGRAMVVVSLGLAVLCAIGFAALRGRNRSRWWTPVALALLVVELAPAPFPLVSLDYPPIYDTLVAQAGSGAVLELPVGIRDGLGAAGALDHRVLWYQTRHERPLLGGFVARLSPSVRRRYETDALLIELLTLSSGDPVTERQPRDTVPTAALFAYGIRFVVLNRETAPPPLVRFVEQHLPLTKIADAEGRALYAVR